MVANDPIPSVSKKSVTKPIASCFQPGQPPHFARACRNQKTANPTATAPSTTNNAVFASIGPDSYPGTRVAGDLPQSVPVGQTMSVVMMPPVPVVQPLKQVNVEVLQTWPATLHSQKIGWPQLSVM